MAYQLYYWPGLQGRGEFVRLALEAAGAPYTDLGRGEAASGQGMPALLHCLQDPSAVRPPFACPVLVDGKLAIAQTAAILLYLGPRLKLVGAKPDAALHWSLDDVEDIFHRIAMVSQGRPSGQEALPVAPEFYAAMVILRESLHHLRFGTVVVQA